MDMKYLGLIVIVAIVMLIGGYYIGQTIAPTTITTITATVTYTHVVEKTITPSPIYTTLTVIETLTIVQETPISIVDALGRSIVFEKTPERVVSLAPSITEILFALGLRDRVVGVTSYCNYPPEVLRLVEEGKIAVIGGYWTPDVEKILALKPDLVIGSSGTRPHIQLRERLEEAGIKIIYIKGSGATNIYEIYEDIATIAKIFGVEDTARKIIQDIDNEIRYVTQKLGEANVAKLKVLQLAGPPSWGLYSAGGNTFIGWVISTAGGINIAQRFTGWPQLDYEFVIAENPDVIIVSAMGANYTAIIEEIRGTPLADTKAFKEGRVYLLDKEANDILVRPGPRVGKAVVLVAKILYPEIFGEPDTPIVYRMHK
ncbi:MAG: ABC transporter substrate-binding protein [Ignisphaera sp.]